MTSPPLMVSPGLYEKAFARGIDPKYVELMFDVLGITDVQSLGGANANGKADTSAAIEKVDSYVSVNGGSVLFSPGTYRIARDLTILNPPVFDPGSLLLPDAGVTVTVAYRPDAGAYQIFSTANGGAFAFAPEAAASVYIEWFGATADLVADDAAAAQAAAVALPSTGGGIDLLSRSYRFDAGVQLLRAGTAVRMAAGGAIVCAFVGGHLNDTALFASGVDNVSIDGVTIRGALGTGIGIDTSVGSSVRRSSVSGATQNNTHGFSAGIFVQGVDRMTIEENDCFGNGSATGEGHADIIANLGTTQITNSRILYNNCRSTAVNQNLALFDPFRCLVQGNKVSGAKVSPVNPGRQGYGILLYNTVTVDPSLVGECQVLDNEVNDVDGCGVFTQRIRDSVVDANVTNNTGANQDDTSLPVAGIACEGINSVVTNNRIQKAHKAGIDVSGNGSGVVGSNVLTDVDSGVVLRGPVDGVTVADNQITRYKQFGIGSWDGTDAAMTHLNITGNEISAFVGSAGTGKGIFLPPSSTICDVSDNYVAGDGGGQTFDLQGTATTADNNRLDGGLWPNAVSANRGDADVALTYGKDFEIQLFNTQLTANRTVTLATTNIPNGARFRIMRRNNLGAFSLSCLGQAIPGGDKGFIDVEYSAALFGWTVTAFGTFT